MALSSIEAVDLLRFADALGQRLQQAAADVAGKRGFEREQQWLHQAQQILMEAMGESKGLMDRAQRLPELADELREELAGSLQAAWVDALEKLLAGITFHVSSRSPIIEALYPTQKLAALRRAPREVVRKFHSDFEKRLKSGYVTRMLAADDFAFAQPVIEGVREAYSRWHSCFEESGMPEAEAAPIREALVANAERVDLAARQARHLAEAALAPLAGVFEEHQLGVKPKKRARSQTPAAPPAVQTAPPEEPVPLAPPLAPEQSPPSAAAGKAPRRRKVSRREDTAAS